MKTKSTIVSILLKTLLFGVIISISFNSCSTKKQSVQSLASQKKEYTPTKLPNDTTQLWIRDTSIERDTILIVGEGGPKNSLDYANKGRMYWENLDNFNSYYPIVIHQSSTYNTSIFNAEKFTLEDGYKEAESSAEILYRTIKYFKDRNKYVIVVGHSYSAFVILYYIANRPSLADTYLITGGRLNVDSLQTQYLLKGYNSRFEEDGKTLIIPDTTKPRKKNRTERYFKIEQVKGMLKLGIGNFKFTEELADKDISNVIFFYGKKDRNLGEPTNEEIDFLKAKKAKVYGVDTNHYNIWKSVIDSLRAGTIKL